jgi:hypothetical protein
VILSSLVYLYSNRYYFRFIPITPGGLAWLDKTFPGKIASTFTLKSNPELSKFDLLQQSGVRQTLKFVRNFSPLVLTNGRVVYSNLSIGSWLKQLKSKAGYCTDFSLLLSMIAIQQDIPVREWVLWSSKKWQGGDAHSIVEIFNKKTQKWQLLDGQHAIIFKAAEGAPLSMVDLFSKYYPDKMDQIIYQSELESSEHVTPFLKASKGGVERGIHSVVLNFKYSPWFAATPKSELVIGLAILTGNSSHDPRIYTTKILALFSVLLVILFTLSEFRVLKSKK